MKRGEEDRRGEQKRRKESKRKNRKEKNRKKKELWRSSTGIKSLPCMYPTLVQSAALHMISRVFQETSLSGEPGLSSCTTGW